MTNENNIASIVEALINTATTELDYTICCDILPCT